MARPLLRVAANLPCSFSVDATCNDYSTCWRWDPNHFAPAGSTAHVQRQPEGEAETEQGLLALQA